MLKKSLVVTVCAAGNAIAGATIAAASPAPVPPAPIPPAPITAELTADDFLAPYYAQLRDQVDLPEAPPAMSLAQTVPLTRIAFGSCNHQSRSQHMWAQIAAKNPQLFLLIGDNVYGDNAWAGDAGLASLRAAYAEQAAHPEFASFRAATPMLTTWDDHDYGLNDSGAVFPFRRWAEEIYENFWDVSPEARARHGIYESRMVGPEGQRVQILLLDTRYFRSVLKRAPYQDPRPPLGGYLPDDSTDAEMLGDAQWEWLAAELAKPADLRLVVSSIQVLTDAHQYESWATMPGERSRLFEALTQRDGGGILLMSGDRHSGGIYTAKTGSAGEDMWEITSSPLNLAFGTTEENTKREPDPVRITDFIAEENFGMVEIDWAARALNLSLIGNQGEVRAQQKVSWTD